MTALGLFALALALLVALAVHRKLPPERRVSAHVRNLLARAIERRFGGYVHALVAEDPSLPERLAAGQTRRVAVIGAGLAGIGAAHDLAARGFRVVLMDRNSYLGGKIGAWREESADGSGLDVEHGFHAFFRHYYNLNAFLERTGLRSKLVPVDDYLILDATGRAFRFGDVDPAPVLNLLALAKTGLFRFRDLLFSRAVFEMDALLAYDEEQTFTELDHVSFAEFAERAALPPELRLVFSTFARSFFADDTKLSMAELIKSFHFYYLSHDGGLLYDYPLGGYRKAVLEPLAEALSAHGVELRLGHACQRIVPEEGGIAVDAERFDYVVLATSIGGARELILGSPELTREDPALAAKLRRQHPGQRYAVWRIWIDRDVRQGLPVFVSTERLSVLDAVALCHRIDVAQGAWARKVPRGAVLELHSYALPDELDEGALRATFERELLHYFPELAGFRVVHEALQVRRDFTAFHLGLHDTRPATQSALERLVLAGDWVRLPCPAMLMEAAYTASLLATNAVLERERLRPYPVLSVPLRGLLYEARRRKLRRRARQGSRAPLA